MTGSPRLVFVSSSIYRIVSHRIVSYRIVSYCIVLYRMLITCLASICFLPLFFVTHLKILVPSVNCLGSTTSTACSSSPASPPCVQMKPKVSCEFAAKILLDVAQLAGGTGATPLLPQRSRWCLVVHSNFGHLQLCFRASHWA